jgi:DNA topoisomerase IA
VETGRFGYDCKCAVHGSNFAGLKLVSLFEELEKAASRKLKINAKETMKIAEKLYTKGYISYPRTETNMFPKDFNLNGLIEQQANNHEWGGVSHFSCSQNTHAPI